MKPRTLIAALSLAFAGGVSACDAVSVTIMPFDLTRDYVHTFAQLTAGGMSEFGEVRVEYSATLRGCSLTLGYAAPVLRIASELARDKCAFGYVLAHEEGHVTIYRDALSTLAARVQARATEPDLMRVASEELDAVKAAHAAHDSPEEYEANGHACGGRVLRLVGLR